jgi:hypothetical protein
MFYKFSTGNFYVREQGTPEQGTPEQGLENTGTGNTGTHRKKQNQVPFPCEGNGEGGGKTIFDTLIIPFKTSSYIGQLTCRRLSRIISKKRYVRSLRSTALRVSQQQCWSDRT